MKPNKVTKKAWAVVDSENGHCERAYLNRSTAIHYKLVSIMNLNPYAWKKWNKRLKVIPCTISYSLPPKSKKK